LPLLESPAQQANLLASLGANAGGDQPDLAIEESANLAAQTAEQPTADDAAQAVES